MDNEKRDKIFRLNHDFHDKAKANNHGYFWGWMEVVSGGGQRQGRKQDS